MNNEEKNWTAKQSREETNPLDSKKLILREELHVCHLYKRWELPPAMQQQQPRTVASR